MRLLASTSLTILLLTLSGEALAQQWSVSASPSGYSYYGPAGYGTKSRKVDNIGNAGQWVFGVERVTSLAFENQSLSYDDPMRGEITSSQKTTALNLFGAGATSVSTLPRLALDYLVLDHVSVGASFVVMTRSVSVDGDGAPASGDGGSELSLLGAVRAGYAFPFDETFGVWGRAGVAYGYQSVDFEVRDVSGATLDATQTTTSFDVTLDVMAVLSPFKHFVLMGGPFLDLGIGGAYERETAGTSETDDRNAKLTAFGLAFAVSGYY